MAGRADIVRALAEALGRRGPGTYERAVARRAGAEEARAAVLGGRHADVDEYASFTNGRLATRPVRGGPESVHPGRVPPSMRGEVDLHHTHPIANMEPGIPAPISLQDLLWLIRQRRVQGMFAHETGGGGSFARRGGKAGHRKAEEAINEGRTAALTRLSDPEDGLGETFETRLFASAIPLNNAARRHGILREFGYSPSTAEQDVAISALEPALREAERDAFRAMHRPIYGLPYPLTYGRLLLGAGGATGGGFALREALGGSEPQPR